MKYFNTMMLNATALTISTLDVKEILQLLILLFSAILTIIQTLKQFYDKEK